MPSETSDTQSKLQRKRERDRRSQRLARERTKARVASLESLVQDIVQQDASGSNAMLIQEMASVKEQRDQLAKALEYIARIAATHAQPSVAASQEVGNLSDALVPTRIDGRRSASSNPGGDSGGVHCSPTTRHDPAKDTSHFQAEQDYISFADLGMQNSFDDSAAHTEGLDPCIDTMNTEIQPSIRPVPASCTAESSVESVVLPYGSACACNFGKCHPQNGTKTRWRLANENLSKSVNITLQQGSLYEEMNDDIPVRAVLEGWHSVMEFWNLAELPEVWQILRGLDDAMFACDTGAVERIAAYRLCYRRIAALCASSAQGCDSLPSWYLPRPSQDLPHSSATDFVPWPGARERLVVHEHRYCSDTYWLAFARNLRILWPYSERDCYMTSGKTYRVSSYFDECLRDLKRWTLSPDFFVSYPELLSDIPAFSTAPRGTSSRTQLQLGQGNGREDSAESSPDTWGTFPHTDGHDDDMTLQRGAHHEIDWETLVLDANWGSRVV